MAHGMTTGLTMAAGSSTDDRSPAGVAPVLEPVQRPVLSLGLGLVPGRVLVPGLGLLLGPVLVSSRVLGLVLGLVQIMES